METFSAMPQGDGYAQQNLIPKNTGGASNLPRLEELLTGIPTIDEVIRTEYDKLANQKQQMSDVAQQVETPAAPQASSPESGTSIVGKPSAFPANTSWWSA
jgi:hypothetical protein